MEDTIGMTIESILNQDYPYKEIIVINDGSDDKTEEILKKYPIKFITTGKIGISNARNLGFKTSKGEFVAFTDADCELDPSWTKNILKGFKTDKVGLVGGMTQFRIDESFSSIYRSIEFFKRYKNIKTDEVVWAGGPGSIFRRKVLEEIGGFNPKWVHGEDAEISFLTIEHGYVIRKQNDAITYHVPESGLRRLVRKGYRDAKAYVRVTKSHTKTSFRNKFNTTWYFRYDLILLPIFYLFVILSGILLPIFFLLEIIFYLPIFIVYLFSIWFWIFIFTCVFLFVYGLIPSIQVFLKKKKIRSFFGALILHQTRGFAWGLGLLFGFKEYILKKN